jgi:steroid delta-isomerase-like uncharacterized protein
MSAEINKKIVRRLVEDVINRGDLEAFDELVATDYVDLSDESDPVGRDEYKELVRATRAALPDLHLIIEGEVAERDTVALRFRATATHAGPFLGVPSTGRRLEWTGMGWLRVRDGQVIERRNVTDVHGILQQLAEPTHA